VSRDEKKQYLLAEIQHTHIKLTETGTESSVFIKRKPIEMMKQKMTLDEINDLKKDTFVRKLGGLFEGPPWIVARAWSYRPFTDLDQLHQTLCSIMYQASVGQQVALLCAHPDLVGRAALAGTLSPASKNEQAVAGLDSLTLEEIALFQKFNQAYRTRFGFPFVICARENKKESILAGFTARLSHSYAQEMALALAEVAKICALRLHDLVEDACIPQKDAV
jgi:2-oxo-4-hydroxy-4-carboxy-5-ureidoimidazoline decarboxylase